MADLGHLNILRKGVEVWNKWRKDNPDIQPNLNEANLSWKKFNKIDFRNSQIRGARLAGIHLNFANLSHADLSGSRLSHASLINANLYNANLFYVNISHATLTNVDMTDAQVGLTTLGDIDLSSVKGLNTVRHKAPSIIGVDTVYRSKGKIAEDFLRGAGLPESFIMYVASLTEEAYHFFSCFISYSRFCLHFSVTKQVR